jgi:hypothetical protein
VRLAVLLGFGVVELEAAKTGTGHEEEGDILDLLSGLLVAVLYVMSKLGGGQTGKYTYTEELEDTRVADKEQCNRLRTALLHGRRHLTEDSVRSLSRLVPRRHLLASQGVDHLLGVEVFAAVRILLEELAASVSEQLVVRYLQLEGFGIPLIVELDVVGVDEGELLVGCLGGEDVGEGHVLEAYGLPDLVVVGDVDSAFWLVNSHAHRVICIPGGDTTSSK